MSETFSEKQSAALSAAPCSARARFEAWITAPPFEKDIARSAHDQTKFAWPGQYRSYEVQLAWEAWCEAIGVDPFEHPRANLADAIKAARELLGEVARDEINVADELEKWDRAFAHLLPNPGDEPRPAQQNETPTS